MLGSNGTRAERTSLRTGQKFVLRLFGTVKELQTGARTELRANTLELSVAFRAICISDHVSYHRGINIPTDSHRYFYISFFSLFSHISPSLSLRRSETREAAGIFLSPSASFSSSLLKGRCSSPMLWLIFGSVEEAEWRKQAAVSRIHCRRALSVASCSSRVLYRVR